jgi:hypothetical protein
MMRDYYYKHQNNQSAVTANDTNLELVRGIRNLWRYNALWMRFYIVSSVQELDDLAAVTKKLRSSPRGAEVFLKYYGLEKTRTFEEITNKLVDLLIKWVTELKSGNPLAAAVTRRQLSVNSTQLSEFLASINPNWDKDQWVRMFEEYYDLIEKEVALYFDGKYEESIAQYEIREEHLLKMADMMINGIIKQFNL